MKGAKEGNQIISKEMEKWFYRKLDIEGYLQKEILIGIVKGKHGRRGKEDCNRNCEEKVNRDYRETKVQKYVKHQKFESDMESGRQSEVYHYINIWRIVGSPHALQKMV